MMRNALLSLFLLLGVVFNSQADSPLTSTYFAETYNDEDIVNQALLAKGQLTVPLMDYLVNEANPIAVKLAVINALGWQYEGKNNCATFLKYLGKKKKMKTPEKVLKKGSAHDIICMAYLKAMDNYFDVKEAAKWSRVAQEIEPYSYSLHLIAAVIQAQEAFDTDWCKVFQLTDAVRNNTNLEVDMRDQSYAIIYEYMDLYQSSCTGE
jgi:hypothetical protein